MATSSLVTSSVATSSVATSSVATSPAATSVAPLDDVGKRTGPSNWPIEAAAGICVSLLFLVLLAFTYKRLVWLLLENKNYYYRYIFYKLTVHIIHKDQKSFF